MLAGIVGAAASTAVLPEHQWQYLFVLGFQQYGEVLPHTLAAFVLVTGFWTLSAAIYAGILLRLDSTMGLTDAVLGGYLTVWVVSFIGGNLLGPLGLMTSSVVWATVLASGVALALLGPPTIPRPRPTPGLWILAIGFCLMAPGLLAVQLGAPLAPFMDILATPASAQRVLTFGRYEPLDSDPYGYWDAGSQCPASELLYAWLSLGGGVSYAAVGQTGAILMLTALLMLAVYRLGRTVGGDVAGGFAGVFVIATVLPRVLPYSHGRTISHILVAAGLAWFCERSGSPVRRALGTLTLATAVGAHAVVGALGMGVAALTLVAECFDLGFQKTVAGVVLLGGASLVAFPEVVVGIRLPVPYPGVPVVQFLGLAVVIAAARWFAGEPQHARLVTRLLRIALVLLAAWATIRNPPLIGGMQDHWRRFPVLFYGSIPAFAALVWIDAKRRSPARITPIVVALLLGMIAEKASADYWKLFTDPRVSIAVQGFFRKVDYWYQFAWTVPVGCLAAVAARLVTLPVAVFAGISVLFIPAGVNQNPNYYQQSIPAAWSEQAALAKGGYWGSTGHRRWGQTPAQFELARILREEIAASRITFETHVTHLEPFVMLAEDNVLFSVYTGINDDTYIAGDWELDISNVGGRVFTRRDIADALARRPPYVVVHDRTRNGRVLPEPAAGLVASTLGDYETLLDDDGVRLLRRPDLRPRE